MSNVVPISQLGHRMPEHGRIRLGVKTARAMKSIDTFRFTSPDAEAISQIAALYGGVPNAWHEPKARIKNQWEVITEKAQIRIFLPPDALSSWYELWSGGGCTRRCDGEVCQVPQQTADGADMVDVACICAASKNMECRPYTRLNVVLPEVRFGGAWRLETKGWNAAHEMPAMARMIEQLQSVGLVEAQLILERRGEVKHGKTKNFVVPKLLVDTSPLGILEGAASVGALSEGTSPRPHLALAPAPTSDGEWFDDDDRVVDAELVEDKPLVQRATDLAHKFDQQPSEKLAEVLTVSAEIATRLRTERSFTTDEQELREACAMRISSARTAKVHELTDDELETLASGLRAVRDGSAELAFFERVVEQHRAGT